MAEYIADIDVLVPDGDVNYIDELDTIITEFKQKVKASFPNVDIEVSVTPAQFNQLVDNNFTSTVRENGVEVAKLSGALFSGPVFDPGLSPAQSNQLVNRGWVVQAIADALAQVNP